MVIMASKLEDCKTLNEIDVRNNHSIQNRGRKAIGEALLEAKLSGLRKWQCDAISMRPEDISLVITPFGGNSATLVAGQNNQRKLLRKKSSRKASWKSDFGIAEVTLLAGLIKWNETLTSLDLGKFCCPPLRQKSQCELRFFCRCQHSGRRREETNCESYLREYLWGSAVHNYSSSERRLGGWALKYSRPKLPRPWTN